MSGITHAANGLAVIQDTLNMRFEYDGRGRIAAYKQSHDLRLPLLVLGRCREGLIWRFRSLLRDDQVRDVARLCGRELSLGWVGEGIPRPPERWVMMERIFARDGVVETRHEWLFGESSLPNEPAHSEAMAELWEITEGATSPRS